MNRVPGAAHQSVTAEDDNGLREYLSQGCFMGPHRKKASHFHKNKELNFVFIQY